MYTFLLNEKIVLADFRLFSSLTQVVVAILHPIIHVYTGRVVEFQKRLCSIALLTGLQLQIQIFLMNSPNDLDEKISYGTQLE